MALTSHSPHQLSDAPSFFGPMDWIAMVLMIVGGLNWGLVGLMNFDLVAAIFGELTLASRAVYAAVGLAALYGVYLAVQCARRETI